MDVTRNTPTDPARQKPRLPSEQESTARLVTAFQRPLFGLDTEALAKVVAQFRYPEKAAAEITQFLEKSGADPMEISRFERDMAHAMETRFEPMRVLGIAVGPFWKRSGSGNPQTNALAGTAAMAQALGGEVKSFLGIELGFTRPVPFFGNMV